MWKQIDYEAFYKKDSLLKKGKAIMRLMKAFRYIVFMMAGMVLSASMSDGVAAMRQANQAKEGAASAPLALKAVGTQILNSKNEPVRLHGVNCASLEWTSDGEGHIVESVRVAIDDWHVNHIRLPLSQDRWFGKAPEQNDHGKAYRAIVDKIVKLCTSKGIYIMLELHWSNAGVWGEQIGQHSMPDEHSVTFWKDLAPIYANHLAVIYDLYNEPHDVSWDVWLNGGQITDRPNQRNQTPRTFKAVGMQQLLDTIRATGAKNLVVVGGLDWAYDFSGILEGRQLKDPDGNGVIYANHCYNNKNQAVETWIANMEKAAGKLPIIISEFGGAYFKPGDVPPRSPWGFGGMRRNDGDWLMRVLQAIEEHKWSYTAWDFHPAAGPTLISGWDYKPTPYFGTYVKQMLVGELPSYTPPESSETPVEPASVQPSPSRIGGWRLYGDWEVKVDSGERQMDAILSFSRDREGNLIAQWISFWGLTELKDVRFEDNKLSFIQIVRFNDNEFSSNFVGTIKDGTLSGILSNDRSDSKVEGTRAQRIPLAVGNWEMKFLVDEREITTALVVRQAQEGKWAAKWQSEWGEHEITDFQYERGRITFKRTSKFQDRQWNSAFEGTIQWQTDTLSGLIKSELGEFAAQGNRVNSELIGNWNLDVTSEWGVYKQRLKVNRDMTGKYGTIPIEEVHVEDDKVSFLVTMQFGDREFEMTFKGKLADSKLTGELKTSRDTQKIVGKKAVRIF